MKIRNLSKLALAVAISSSVVLEGCKKYDDDITRLEQSIEQNKSDIAALKTQLQSLAANNVVESVTPITGGFRIVFKSPTGQSTTYDIVNGAKGDTGATGPQGPAGTPGTPGATGANGSSPIVTIGSNGNFWISNNGQAATDTGVKAQGPKGDNGQDGKDGVDGTSVTIVDGADGKKYWALNGKATTVQAYAGDIAMEETDGGYNVVFTDAKGVSSSLFLAKEQVAVNSLSLVPTTATGAGNNVIFFPRIIKAYPTDKATLLQGYATVKYNLNPYGVAKANYDATGLLVQETDKVEFRSSGQATSDKFSLVGSDKDTFGEITVKLKPVGNANDIFGAQLYNSQSHLNIALQIKNHKAASNQQFITSGYNLAGEELIDAREVTIEKSAKDNSTGATQISLANGVTHSFSGYSIVAPNSSSLALAHSSVVAASKSTADFTLHYKNDAAENLDNNVNYIGGKTLDSLLNGFFRKGQLISNGGPNSVVSMDNNGLSDYNIQYELANPTSTQADWLTLDPVSGKISVKISTVGSKAYNSAAVNNFAIVKATIYAGQTKTTEIASRYIKVAFTQDAPQVINVVGSVEHDVVSTSVVYPTITWSTPTTLDAAYNRTGKTAEDFHKVYSFVSDVPTTSGIQFYDWSMGWSQGNPRYLSITNQVMPETYTVKGRYVSTISTDPIVEIAVTVKVKGSMIPTLVKNTPFWDATGTYGIINGKLVGSSWKLNAQLWDYFNRTSIPTGSSNPPIIIYDFALVDAISGITISKFSETNSEISLNEAILDARNKVNNGDVALKVIRYVNGVQYDLTSISPNFNVKFINPVKAIITKAPYKEFKDKEVSGSNISQVDVRRLVKLTDFNNTTLYDYNNDATNIFATTLVNNYGITGITAGSYGISNVVFTRAENASGATVTLPASTRAFVSTNNLTWENLGANLQQPIYLVYTITIPNKFNNGSVTSTKGEVVKEIKVKVNPNI